MSHFWLIHSLAAADFAAPIIAWGKLVPVALVALLWFKASEFTFADSFRIGLNPNVWAAAVLGAGLLGFLIALFLPIYWLGLPLQIFLTFGSAAAYVFYRNGKVPKDQRLGSLVQIKTALLTQIGRRPISKREQAPDTETALAVFDHLGRVVVRPDDPADQPAHDAVRRILFDAIQHRASEVEVVLSQNGQVFYKIDGLVTNRETLELPLATGLVGLIKTYAKLDRRETRKPQEGRFNGKALNKDLKMYVLAQGSREGQRMKIRFLGEDVAHRINDLGLLTKQVEDLTALQQAPGGLILVAGKRGHGLSTTIYALARGHDAFMRNMISFERRELMKLENIKQVVVPADTASQSIAREIAAQMTGDPDILLVDPLDNQAAAQAVLDALKAGKKVYASIAQPDMLTALAQWLKWIGDMPAGMEHVQAVMAQRLLRKLCITCREAYTPDPAILKKANLPVDKVKEFFRPPTHALTDDKGNPIVCQDCQGTGYVGQMSLFELFVIGEQARKLIVAGGTPNQIKAEARRNKMLYLQEVGLRRVIEGATSIQEVLRVTQE